MSPLRGSLLHEVLLTLYNKMWHEGEIVPELCETLISYIYKGKGGKDELTSYRPIALTSAIMNVMKKMMLVRLTEAIMPQITLNQGGFRKGVGSKEQLWTLIENIEESTINKEEMYMCATDVHKAYDQVYRNGTYYILYTYGIKGKMLDMVMQWVDNNWATPLCMEGNKRRQGEVGGQWT